MGVAEQLSGAFWVDAMSIVSGARRQVIAGWAWLVLGVAARGYLVLMAAFAACALLPLAIGFMGSVVISGSMQPLITPGDVVLSLPLGANDPEPMGRVVIFPETDGSAGIVVLHRIVAKNLDGSFVTAGDANAEVDVAPLHLRDVLGTARLLVPWVGLPVYWLASGSLLPFSLWVLVTLLALFIEVRLGISESREEGRLEGGPEAPEQVRVPPVLAPAMLAGAMVLVACLAAMLLVPVEAAFSARTVSVGNSWSMAAAVPATRLAFSVNPSSSTGGAAFAMQPVVLVQDSAGKTTTGTRTVALALTVPSGASLTCAANTVTATTGIVKFAGCAIDKVGTYTLTATSGTLTAAVSARVTITVGPAAALRFTTSPSGGVAAAAFTTQPVVSVFDAGGNPRSSTAAITLSLTTPAGATLGCAKNPVNAVGGVATFAGCKVDLAGAYSLTARASGLASVTSGSFAISAPVPPLLRCDSTIWMATFSWSPTPQVPTTYHLFVNGVSVPATGADGWNSYVQLNLYNLPLASFPKGTATVEVRKVLASGAEQVIGTGNVVIGPDYFRTYTCG